MILVRWPGAWRAALRLGTTAFLASLLLTLVMLGPGTAAAATPAPTSDVGGDTRSVGEGPGLVGSPLLAIGGVLALGLVSAGLTVAYVRATDRTRTNGADGAADDTRPA